MQEPDIKTKVKNIFENARQMPTFFSNMSLLARFRAAKRPTGGRMTGTAEGTRKHAFVPKVNLGNRKKIIKTPDFICVNNTEALPLQCG